MPTYRVIFSREFMIYVQGKDRAEVKRAVDALTDAAVSRDMSPGGWHRQVQGHAVADESANRVVVDGKIHQRLSRGCDTCSRGKEFAVFHLEHEWPAGHERSCLWRNDTPRLPPPDAMHGAEVTPEPTGWTEADHHSPKVKP